MRDDSMSKLMVKFEIRAYDGGDFDDDIRLLIDFDGSKCLGFHFQFSFESFGESSIANACHRRKTVAGDLQCLSFNQKLIFKDFPHFLHKNTLEFATKIPQKSINFRNFCPILLFFI